jgi:hypothetical protein
MSQSTGAASTAAVAARCLEDADFARQILEGEEYPDVRAAIIADLDDEESVKGHIFSTGQNYINPQPLPPSPAAGYLKSPVFNNWLKYDRIHLRNLAFVR